MTGKAFSVASMPPRDATPVSDDGATRISMPRMGFRSVWRMLRQIGRGGRDGARALQSVGMNDDGIEMITVVAH